jgi:hypothetical protein
MKPSRYIAGFDSSTGCLRALSRFLHGKDFPAPGTRGGDRLRPFVRLVSALPRRLREEFHTWSGWAEALPPRQLVQVDSEEMARWTVDHYPRRQYPAVAIGSSGGSVVHLCAALGIPWLPQTFLIPVRTNYAPDEPRHALRFGEEKAPLLLEDNPDLVLHHMHDVARDRLMLAHMTYFRVKRLRLGQAFSEFLTDGLEPGGTLFLVECERRWPTLRVGPSHVFQHGAVGGLSPEEYEHGGEAVEEYLRRCGIPKKRWDTPAPDGDSPEAEWGFEPALREDVEEFARRHGYRVRRILYTEPRDLSPLVADLYRWWYRQRRMKVSRLLVESFMTMEPWWTLRTGSVPFWMTFNEDTSADALEQYLREAEPFNFIHLMLFQHGTEGPRLATTARWRELLGKARQWGDFLGVDPEKHPRDFAALVRYHADLRKISARYPMPGPLSLSQLEHFLEDAGDKYPVRWVDVEPPQRPGTHSPDEEERGPWLH